MVIGDKVLKVESKNGIYKIYQGTGYGELMSTSTHGELIPKLVMCYVCQQFYDGRMTEVGTFGYNFVSKNKAIIKYVKEHYYEKLNNSL